MINIESKISRSFKDGCDSMTNFIALEHGGVKRPSYKTIRGFIKMLRQQNKLLKKHNIKATFTITLPVPE